MGREEKFEETAKEKVFPFFMFDAFSFTVCNVSHVTSHHLPLIIPFHAMPSSSSSS